MQKMGSPVPRKGKWTAEEEMYAVSTIIANNLK